MLSHFILEGHDNLVQANIVPQQKSQLFHIKFEKQTLASDYTQKEKETESIQQ